MIKQWLLHFLIFFASTTFANAGVDLFFYPEKNGIQVLKQKFEFYLMNEEQLQIGDVLIDSSSFSMNLLDIKNPKIRFSWPGTLFKNGRIVVKDNAGKGLYSQTFNFEAIQLETPEIKHPELRDEIASIVTSEVSFDFIEELRKLPFFTFCIYKLDEEADLTACSREYFIPRTANPLIIKPRAQGKKEAFAEINGKPVTKQGQIFLPGGLRVQFRTQLKSGTFVEIKTTANPLDIFDIAKFNDRRIHIRARGAEPLNSSLILERHQDGSWTGEIDIEKPVIYIRASGEIPLRQDFLFPKDLPTTQMRIKVKEKLGEVYSDSIKLSGSIPSDVKLATIAANSPVSFNEKEKGTFLWNLDDLNKRELNRRVLTVSSKGKNFNAGYEVFRGASTDLALGYHIRTSSSNSQSPDDKTSAFSFRAQHWLTDFLDSNEDWSHLRWGLEINALNRNAMTSEALIHFRFTPGIHNNTSTYGLSGVLLQSDLKSNSFSGFGLGVFGNLNANSVILGDWFWFQINYLPQLTKVKSGAISELSIQSRYYINQTLYWNWNFIAGNTSLKLDRNISASESSSLFGIGMGYQF